MKYCRPVTTVFVLANCLLLSAVHRLAAEAPKVDTKGADVVRVVRSQMIWDAAPHNAFTDLTRWNDRWYCSFREGAGHSSYDGAARILSSRDGREWRSVIGFAKAGLDLRDPKLCVLPDGRLLLGVGVRRQIGNDANQWATASHIYVTRDGEKWDGPHTVGDANVWMWRYVAHRGYVYSFGYAKRQSKTGGGETFLRFYRSHDAVHWDTIAQTEAGGGYVNETAFVFEPDDRCVALLRREGGNSRLGLAQPPYDHWTWSDLGERFNGPALLRLPDGSLLAGGRSKALAAQSAKTAIGLLTTNPPALRPLLLLPSQHETGYPGFVFQDGRVWVSYYSSQSGKCAIYIAELELMDEQDE